MRTTLTLDDDVTALLQKEMRKSGSSFRSTVNHFLRLGILEGQRRPEKKPFVIKSRPLGLPPGMRYDSVSELIENLEGPLHK